jgi:hypothetical protein
MELDPTLSASNSKPIEPDSDNDELCAILVDSAEDSDLFGLNPGLVIPLAFEEDSDEEHEDDAADLDPDDAVPDKGDAPKSVYRLARFKQHYRNDKRIQEQVTAARGVAQCRSSSYPVYPVGSKDALRAAFVRGGTPEALILEWEEMAASAVAEEWKGDPQRQVELQQAYDVFEKARKDEEEVICSEQGRPLGLHPFAMPYVHRTPSHTSLNLFQLSP